MKKYSIVIPLFAMLLTACDPTVEEEGSIAANITEADLQARVALTQTTAGQNKFTFSTNPTLTVQVLDQDGAILATGNRGFHHWHSSPHELDRPGYEPRRLDRLLFTRRDNQ